MARGYWILSLRAVAQPLPKTQNTSIPLTDPEDDPEDHGGRVTCYRAKTGELLYEHERLDADGEYWASPIAANDKIYFASARGTISVIDAANAVKVLARNKLGGLQPAARSRSGKARPHSKYHQAVGEAVATGPLARQQLLALRTALQIQQRTPGLLGQLMSRTTHTLGPARSEGGKVLEQDTDSAQISHHEARLIKWTQCRHQTQPVKAGKNSDDIGGVLSYKRAWGVVRCGSDFDFHTNVLSHQRRPVAHPCGCGVSRAR